MIIKKLFLASSSELKEDRVRFEIFISRKNRDWIKRGVFLDLTIWEDFLDAVSQTRLQDEYNKAIRECDIFIMLFFTKVGKYTEEEFETAFGQFKTNGKPLIYTYFKDAGITTGGADRKDLESLWAFQHRLTELGHFHTLYRNTHELELKLYNQLEKLTDNGFIKFKPNDKTARPEFTSSSPSPGLGDSMRTDKGNKERGNFIAGARDWALKQSKIPVIVMLSAGVAFGLLFQTPLPKNSSLPGKVMCESLIGNYRLNGSYVLIDEKNLRGTTNRGFLSAKSCEQGKDDGFVLKGEDASQHIIELKINNKYEHVATVKTLYESETLIDKNGMLFRRTLGRQIREPEKFPNDPLINGRLADKKSYILEKIDEYMKIRLEKHTGLITKNCNPTAGIKDGVPIIANFCHDYTRVMVNCGDCPPI